MLNWISLTAISPYSATSTHTLICTLTFCIHILQGNQGNGEGKGRNGHAVNVKFLNNVLLAIEAVKSLLSDPTSGQNFVMLEKGCVGQDSPRMGEVRHFCVSLSSEVRSFSENESCTDLILPKKLTLSFSSSLW